MILERTVDCTSSLKAKKAMHGLLQRAEEVFRSNENDHDVYGWSPAWSVRRVCFPGEIGQILESGGSERTLLFLVF